MKKQFIALAALPLLAHAHNVLVPTDINCRFVFESNTNKRDESVRYIALVISVSVDQYKHVSGSCVTCHTSQLFGKPWSLLMTQYGKF